MLGVSVCFSEFLSDGFSESFSAFLGLETFVFDFGEVELIDDESGWHDMVLVDVFDEGLHSAFSIKLFGTHLLGNLSGITFNTNNESVAKLFVLKYR